MQQFESSTPDSRRCAQIALGRIGELGLAPVPQLFTLFYTYAAGTHPGLKAEIDARLAGERPLALWECLDLYERFFGFSLLLDRYDPLVATVRRSLDESMLVLKDDDSRRSWLGSFVHAVQSLGLPDQGDASPAAALSRLITSAMQFLAGLLCERDRLALSLQEAREGAMQLEAKLASEKAAARTCALTGLLNRRGFDERLSQEMAIPKERPLAMALADLDHFKSINDAFGHKTGDIVLVRCARILEEVVGSWGCVARIGGEEFALILPGLSLNEAYELATRSRRAIESTVIQLPTTKEQLRRITASFGVSRAVAGDTASSLLERIDQGLYAAKSAGRNRVVSAG